MSYDFFVHPKILVVLNKLVVATGAELILTNPKFNRWHATLTNDRVKATMRFLLIGKHNRLEMRNLDIEVDGKPAQEHVHHTDDLIPLFANPDVEIPCRDNSGKMLPIVGDVDFSYELEQAPTEVRISYEAIKNTVVEKNSIVGLGEITLRVGKAENHWVIDINFPRGYMRMNFICRNSKWVLDNKNQFTIMIDGINRSAEVAGDIMSAMNLIFDFVPLDKPEPILPIRREAQSIRSNSVETRRATVIRN